MGAFIEGFRRACGSSSLAWLVGLNCLVFLAVWIVVLAGNALGAEGNFAMPWLSVPANPEVFLTRPWTALTYMFTQFGFLHLLFNVLWLYWFGVMLYPAVSGSKLVWLYIAGGLSGAAAYLISGIVWSVNPGWLCGSSSAVLAVMTAAALLVPDREFMLFLIGRVKLKWVAAVCIILAFFGAGSGSAASTAAHAAGVLAGLVYGMVLKGRKSRIRNGNVGLDIIRERPVRKNVRRDGNAVAAAAERRLSDPERLDMLLDKIRMSGYGALSTGERNELAAISARLEKH